MVRSSEFAPRCSLAFTVIRPVTTAYRAICAYCDFCAKCAESEFWIQAESLQKAAMGIAHRVQVSVFTDGENKPQGYEQIISGWKKAWVDKYPQVGELSFEPGPNLKEVPGDNAAPAGLWRVVAVRNPDLFFVDVDSQFIVGGSEITTHSPDGSNVEKRYPFLWAAGREGVNGFVLCPYQKTRPTGAINRLPNRHALRNLQLLSKWEPARTGSAVCQILPIRELQDGSPDLLPPEVRREMLGFEDVGKFYAHVLARHYPGAHDLKAVQALEMLKGRMERLSKAIAGQAEYTEPSSLLKERGRWIQVYNTRPDSGHWERGEGQFDSIDGRLMFTLDELENLPREERPRVFEFWLPQMTSEHPWVKEQQARGYGSKRFRNIMVTLKPYIRTKFADDLSDDDWNLLMRNSTLLLERLDWSPGIYEIPASLAGRERLYFSAHKAYGSGWLEDLRRGISGLPAEAVVLVPRIPKRLLHSVLDDPEHQVLPAEACTKEQLIMLRRLHKSRG